MVCRVKAGKLCGAIAGLPPPQETRRVWKKTKMRRGKARGFGRHCGGGLGVEAAGVFYFSVVGEEFRGELL